MWNVTEETFEPQKQHHQETIFTIGNGYLSTRGALEEGYPSDSRATFLHGVFDDVPLVFTELANAPDWLPLQVYLNGERFSLDKGTIEHFERRLDLRTGVLTRTVHWRADSGVRATMVFERFASLADEHLLCLRCKVTPDFDGSVEIRASLNGNMDNDGFAHWHWVEQGERDGAYYLHTRTRNTEIDVLLAMRLFASSDSVQPEYWDAQNVPTVRMIFTASRGET
ncbi:MAG TPA: glycoside hydrolase family 65 protein, partial [Anaerolineales bacterium]|nr:glycoside hydrolase family 65 protein [Anaerolineales bacterium]